MQFIVENKALTKALGLVKGSIRQSTIPVLCHVAVETDKANSRLKIRSSNLEREAEVAVPAEIITDGSAALPGEVLCALARRLPNGGQSEVTKNGRCVKLVSGAAKFDLRYLELTDFPLAKVMPAEGVTRFALPAAQLQTLIASVLYAANPKDNRAFCRGPSLAVEGKKLVATAMDGFRLAEQSVPIPKGAAAMPTVFLPVESAQHILEMLAQADPESAVDLAVSASLLEVRHGEDRIATSLIEARPLDYKHLIPSRETIAAQFRPYVLSEAIERSLCVYLGEKDQNAKSPALHLAFADNGITLEAGVAGKETAAETLEAETNGHDLTFRVDARYFSDALKAWPESTTVSIGQEAPGKAIMLVADNKPEAVHLVMPMKL